MIIYSREIAARMSDNIDPLAYGHEIQYIEQTHMLQLKNTDGTVLSEVDCAAFLKDGMLESVEIVDGYLILHFNVESGKQDISIPLSDIFDPSDYYTKSQTDTAISNAITALNLGDVVTHDVDSAIGEQAATNIPTSSAVKTYVDDSISGVSGTISNATITIDPGFPSSSAQTFTLNQSSNQTISLNLGAAAYKGVANSVTTRETRLVPSCMGLIDYVAGCNFATVSQLPTVYDSTISIKRNTNDSDPLVFTVNASSNTTLNLGLGAASESGVDSSIGSSSSSNLPTSDAVKAYVTGQGYAVAANLGQAAVKGVDSSIGSSSSSNLPTTDAVKGYTYSKAEVDDYIANVVFDQTNNVLTFTRGNGTSFTVSLN